MTWKTKWAVTVDGQSVTAAMTPYLQSITVTDQAGSSSDSCSLVLNDSGGRLRLPQPGGAVSVSLDGVNVFTGIIDSVKSSGSRGSGRMLSVSAKGFDVAGKAKEPVQLHQDDGSVGDFLTKVAKKAGFNMKVDPALANIVRDYIASDGESFLHTGERLARELGGTFKLRGTEAVLAKHGVDFGLPLITGLFNTNNTGNLISWEIEPLSTRPAFNQVEVQYFDRKEGQPKTYRTDSGEAGARAQAVNRVRSVAHDENQAKDIAEARKAQIEREGGKGRVTLNLEPSAQAEALFQLSGTRSGVDGTYRITSVTHKANRSGGATTDLELQQPQDGAGTDSR
ncbi:contractile injection system protein, VgrG/Pvc8 family [uncultured Roseibium sp.]|uniref:phage late control D family protein n=1 Tax=uncultured Roseibium sp. TaxID=1936171 RepID=UPI002607AAF2|nr:contractile injection system protein, VgrG/Pvc8 family [uncultured Roseibium sp.]